jgi:hypothetical protein
MKNCDPSVSVYVAPSEAGHVGTGGVVDVEELELEVVVDDSVDEKLVIGLLKSVLEDELCAEDELSLTEDDIDELSLSVDEIEDVSLLVETSNELSLLMDSVDELWRSVDENDEVSVLVGTVDES